MLHKTAEPVQTSRLGVFTVVQIIYHERISQFFFSLSCFAPKDEGLEGQWSISDSSVHNLQHSVIYRAAAKTQRKNK